MTKQQLEELKSTKIVFNYLDMQKIFNCGEGKARGIILAIKKYNECLPITGKVTTVEFDNWYNQVFNKPIKENHNDTRRI